MRVIGAGAKTLDINSLDNNFYAKSYWLPKH